MALSRDERRALREIEAVLAAEDPRLAALLCDDGTTRTQRLARRTAQWVIGSAIALLVLGIVFSHAGLVCAGLLALAAVPPAVRLVVALFGHGDGAPG